jgi:DNA polymerase-3 subunit delta'
VSEAPHPREVFDYDRGDAVERAFLDAQARGRLHHAWLLTGPEGLGKATFAYRAARRLLGARPDPSRGLLGTSPDDPEARLITAQAHPDFMALERGSEDGKVKKFISVDAARALPEFFSKAPSRSAYRVAIVDAADDMNLNAANALLKTLEEPPERGVLFLVAHAPGRLMATIRSRCRRLGFQPWPDAAVETFLQQRTGLSGEAASELAHMARGAPGRALRLAGSQALELDLLARELVEGRRPQSRQARACAARRGRPASSCCSSAWPRPCGSVSPPAPTPSSAGRTCGTASRPRRPRPTPSISTAPTSSSPISPNWKP